MLAPLLGLFLAATPRPEDRVDARVVATLADDLATLSFEASLTLYSATATDAVTIVLAADREAVIPPLPIVAETQLYARRFSTGGFEGLSLSVAGAPCAPKLSTLPDGARLARCAIGVVPGRALHVVARGTLKIPERFGPFGRRNKQVTLGGGWFPYVAARGRAPPRGTVELDVTIPGSFGAVVGRRWWPPVAGGSSRHIRQVERDAAQLPLIVLPPTTSGRRFADGRALFISRRGTRDEQALHVARGEVRATVEDGLGFLVSNGIAAPSRAEPLLIVEASLRRDLAYALDGVVLLSDQAFRLTPLDRFLRFHRIPLLREVYSAHFTRALAHEPSKDRVLAADALGAWLKDRYVASHWGEAEDAFDVLQLFSFIPAIDSLLYAPQIPFVGAYFRLIDETDPYRPDLIATPSFDPRGKLMYEKLYDRLGWDGTESVMRRSVSGVSFEDSVAMALGQGEASAFFATWRGPYPAVQYRIEAFGSAPCVDAAACHVGTVMIARSGAPVKEPVQVRLQDDDGNERVVWAEATRKTPRTLTATLSAPLVFVELDPFGRLSETPSIEVPSPRYDNRSSPRWRFLLNNFNLLLSPTAGQIETALDVGFSRVRDVRWRFAGRAEYTPASVGLSGRATYYFGGAVTPDRLSHWLGAALSGDYLRPEFAGTLESSLATSLGLYYGYDDRPSSWLPDAGTAVRVGLGYDRTFGAIDPSTNLSADAISGTIRVLRSFRFLGGQQISLRASVASYFIGQPRPQLRYALGGRSALRGYVLGDEVTRFRAIGSVEWVHPIFPDLDENAAFLVWASALDGALFSDVALIADGVDDLSRHPFRADVGYGFRLYLDYFGVRQGVMSIDVAFPLVDPSDGRGRLGPPAVYIDFAQSFLNF